MRCVLTCACIQIREYEHTLASFEVDVSSLELNDVHADVYVPLNDVVFLHN